MSESEKMNNGDVIREMTNSELAVIIMCPYDIDRELCNKKGTCFDCCLEWLDEQVTE